MTNFNCLDLIMKTPNFAVLDRPSGSRRLMSARTAETETLNTINNKFSQGSTSAGCAAALYR